VTLLIPVVSALSLDESQTDRSVEAQRNYDLAVSYIKSDLYVKGLETLNQVAFLFPDSDVADDALYQLALIRELVGDGKVKIGEKKSLESVREELNNLTGSSTKYGITADILTYINAGLKGQVVIELAKSQAIAQYILALDYLNTLTQRYPDSNRIEETNSMAKRIIFKIETLRKSRPQPSLPISTAGDIVATSIVIVIILIIFSKVLIR
jgi:outer membrane protein assembly factor BamD (BamD/ComL family)